MPKELTHWAAAWAGLMRLPPDSPLRRSLETNKSCYLMGAVLPDTLLHFLGGPYRKTAFGLADRFHSSTNNSYLPLINFLDSRENGSITPAVEATLLGIACHMEADILFHPFVYGISDCNMAIHYRVETELDLWFLRKGLIPPVFRVSELLKTNLFQNAIMLLSGVFDPDGQLPESAISKSLENHAMFQSMYYNPAWVLTAKLLAMIPGTPVKNWQWLFYPFFWKSGQDRDWPASWREPATGKTRNDTPEQLFEAAATRISAILTETERSGLKSAFSKQPGENLLTGLPPQ